MPNLQAEVLVIGGGATGTGELQAQWRVERTFVPTMARSRAAELMGEWRRAVARTAA